MTLNCKDCGEVKAIMHPYYRLKNGNVTGMLCSDCKNKKDHEHEHDEEIHEEDRVVGMACECGDVKDNEVDHDLMNKE